MISAAVVLVLLVAVASLAVIIRPEPASADQPAPRFEITPERPLLDDRITIHLLHLQPGQRVTVRAQVVTGPILGRPVLPMKSQAELVADALGTVDVSAVPQQDKDKQVAPNRILWGMKPDPEARNVASARTGALDPYVYTFTAETDGKEIARATMELRVVGPGVVRTPVREKGLVGTFFRPAGSGRHPGIVVFAGSQGGLQEDLAALLAARGYAALALAYFNYEGVPKDLVEIPLEYFGTALEWLARQESVRGDRLGVMGASRGGELALLLGATFPQIKVVVAYVPSHVAWGGVRLTQRPGSGRHGPTEGNPCRLCPRRRTQTWRDW